LSPTRMRASDAALVAAARDGDRRAFAAWLIGIG
jgi:hypothetical protein